MDAFITVVCYLKNEESNDYFEGQLLQMVKKIYE